jgi:hypothetical protein
LFYYFPNNYTWSSAVMLCLMAGGQLGQIDRWLASLRNDARTSTLGPRLGTTPHRTKKNTPNRTCGKVFGAAPAPGTYGSRPTT